MNKIWIWFLKLFSSTKSLPEITITQPSDLSFIAALKKAREEANNPSFGEELTSSIKQNLGKLIGDRYKSALINNEDIIFISMDEVIEDGIFLAPKDGWFITKNCIVKYLKSIGIEAGFYGEYIDIRAKNITKALDSISDSVQEVEQIPPFSIGVYR